MILPIGDEPNPRGTPWVNYLLIAANVLVFVLVSLPLMFRRPDLSDPGTLDLLRPLFAEHPEADPRAVALAALRDLTAYDVFLRRWGYVPGDPSPLALLSSMFLHGGWLHLLGNMLFLWIYGDNVEHRLGRAGYLLAYVATGAAAALAYGAFIRGPAASVPMVGASGAISGVLGFYFLWFPRNRVRLLVFLFPLFFVWRVGARLVLGFYLLVENLLPFLLRSETGGGGVAYGAHIGGFVAGLAMAYAIDAGSELFRRRRLRASPSSDSASGRDAPAPSPAAASIEEAIARDQIELAVQRFLGSPREERLRVPLPALALLAERVVAAGQPDVALVLFRRALEDRPRGPDLDQVFLGIGLTLLHGKGRPTAAYQYLMDALEADPSPEVERRAREALAEIERLQKYPFRSRRLW